MEHLHGLRLIAPAGGEKLIELDPPLLLIGGESRPFESARLRGHQSGPSLPVNRVPEFLAYAKANPDKINYGSASVGSSNHLR